MLIWLCIFQKDYVSRQGNSNCLTATESKDLQQTTTGRQNLAIVANNSRTLKDSSQLPTARFSRVAYGLNVKIFDIEYHMNRCVSSYVCSLRYFINGEIRLTWLPLGPWSPLGPGGPAIPCNKTKNNSPTEHTTLTAVKATACAGFLDLI